MRYDAAGGVGVENAPTPADGSSSLTHSPNCVPPKESNAPSNRQVKIYIKIALERRAEYMICEGL